MAILKMSKQNPQPGTGLRIARIQYTSPLRNQNLYFNHRYNISVKRENLYAKPYKDTHAMIHVSTNGLVANVSNNNFYIKDSGSYIDIAIPVDANVARLVCEIETEEVGSVTMKCDVCNLSDYTRLDIMNPTLNSMFDNSFGTPYSVYLDYSQSKTIKLNSFETVAISMNGDMAIVSLNEIVQNPKNWTLTKGNDITVNSIVVGSEYTITSTSSFRGTVLLH